MCGFEVYHYYTRIKNYIKNCENFINSPHATTLELEQVTHQEYALTLIFELKMYLFHKGESLNENIKNIFTQNRKRVISKICITSTTINL